MLSGHFLINHFRKFWYHFFVKYERCQKHRFFFFFSKFFLNVFQTNFLEYFLTLPIFKSHPKEEWLNIPFSRTIMEERRKMMFLMLCLVVGMLAGQSRARKSDYNKCFDDCYVMCLALSTTSDNLQQTCSNCSDNCELKLDRKFCIFFWCWKVW